MSELSHILRERGYVHQFSCERLEEITDGPKRTVYLGIDPSADSLHVGNLVGLLVLRRFLEDGHTVIILTGGGTGMIGDPGGKSEERNLLDEDTVARNAKAVAAQIRAVFGSSDFTEVNNEKWLSKLNVLEFLRDVGKHFTVNAMIKKDIVRDRLEKEAPISFTEFSYSLLQGYDFLHLSEAYECDVQVGGSDQWSNILAGVDFIRRKADKTVYAFTWPLIINKGTGKKFGKSEAGAVWLDAQKTPPFQFYQFWVNAEDAAVEEYLKLFTTLSMMEIAAAMELHRRDAKERHAQRLLAREVTRLVHGEDAAQVAEKATEVLFGAGATEDIDRATLKMIAAAAPSARVQVGSLIVDALVAAGLATSKGEARRLVSEKGVRLNGETVHDALMLTEGDFHAGIAIIKRGARNVAILTLS